MRHADLVDVAEFELAYASHRDTMVAAAHKVLRDPAAAEDVVQDVFLQLWRAPDRYDRARGSLRTYLMVLARSRAVDRWRSRAAAGGALERVTAEAVAGGVAEESAAEQVIRSETAREVRQAVELLPHPQREAILLAYAAGLSAPELAAATGAPLGTAKSRLRLGLRAAGKTLVAAGAR